MARAAVPDRHDLSTTPVAVLTGSRTGSSGEFVAIAFRGRPNAVSIGMPTGGVPTANEQYRLSDGALLNLTIAQDADRTGHVYPDAPIQPDKFVTTASPTHTRDAADPAIRSATKWLAYHQPTCR